MRFPDTQWSLLAQATLHNENGGADALAAFCNHYRPPIVEFIRRRGYPANDAEDLAHDFFIHVIEKSALRRAQEARGRFRSFLLGALVRFLSDANDRRMAQKRGGAATVLSLDANDEDDFNVQPAVSPPDAEVFDRQWALGLLALAIEGLETNFRERNRVEEFTVLRAFIPGGVKPPSYETAAGKLGMTVPALKTEVHRLRARFREQLRREIAATVSSHEQIEEEIAYLGRVLRTPET